MTIKEAINTINNTARYLEVYGELPYSMLVFYKQACKILTNLHTQNNSLKNRNVRTKAWENANNR